MKLAKDVFELVIVTYHKDLDRSSKLIKSLRSDTWFGGDLYINLVVNDEPAVYDAAKSAVAGIDNITVYLGQDFGVGPAQGWRTQQWIKLAISQYIDTDWYMVIDSDQVIWDGVKVNLDDWFCDNKARYKSQPILDYVDTPWFAQYYKNAAAFWGIDSFEQYQNVLSETPPVMFHTTTVLDMLQHCNSKLITGNKVHEAGLYWCYIIKQQLVDQLYLPFDSLNHRNQLMEIRVQ